MAVPGAGALVAVAKRRGLERAKVALARKLAGVLQRLWANAADSRWGKEVVAEHGTEANGLGAGPSGPAPPRPHRRDAGAGVAC
jgi:hypothetical protein